MPKTRSINQNRDFDALPNFRNLGVTLRIVLLVNGMALLLALAKHRRGGTCCSGYSTYPL